MRWKRREKRPDTYWKPHFAWIPVRIEDTGEWVFLEWTWRARDFTHDRFPVTRYRSDVHWCGANLKRSDPSWPNELRK